MKAMQCFKFYRLFWITCLVCSLTGCLTATSSAPSTPFRITMTSPTQFIVEDEPVDSSRLIKVLKKNRVPQDVPLVIEMRTTMPFEAIKLTTQKLATAGYKPFFKSPRHTDASVATPGVVRNPSRIQ